MTQQNKSQTVPSQHNQDAHTSKFYELLAYYDCLTNIAYALVLRNNSSLNDTDFALLNEGYKEIILLTSKGEFLNGNQDICQAIDDYIIQKLPKLGESFTDKRSVWESLQLDINLLMREKCLHTIQALLKIANTVAVIKTPDALQIWDQTLDQSFLDTIEELKKTYLLFDRFPPKNAFPDINTVEEKQLARFLSLHHGTKGLPPEIYKNGKTQFYFMHHLLQVMNILSKLSTELPLLAVPDLRKKPVVGLSEDSSIMNEQIDTMTDCLVDVLAVCEEGPQAFEKVIAPTMKGMIASNRALTHALNLVGQLPRKKRIERSIPKKISVKLQEDARWYNYRQTNLEQSKHKLL